MKRINEAAARLRFEVGQTTAEYALIMLAAAIIVGVLVAWAQGGSELKEFFSSLIGRILEKSGLA